MAVNAIEHRVHREQRYAICIARVTRRASRYENEFGRAAIDDNALVAIQYPVVTFGGRARDDVREIEACLRLCERQRRLQLSGDHRLQPALLLLRAGKAFQGSPRQYDVCKVRFDDQAATKALHYDHDVDWSAVKPAVLFAERHGGPPQLRKHAPDVGTETGVAGGIALTRIEVVLVVDELVDAVGQHLLHFVKGKIHR